MMATRARPRPAAPEEPPMNRIARLVSSLAIALFAALPALAERVSAGDAEAARAVVAAQLAAFAAGDAKRAFSYAAPAIREMFGTPDHFMDVVRAGYPVVYRPAAVIFLAPEWVEGQLLLGVHLTDASGSLWLAIYSLERQADKAWRISGCDVRPSSGKLT
jgi:hypothetical protein